MYKKNVNKFGRNLRLGIRLNILRYVILNCFNKNRNRKYNKIIEIIMEIEIEIEIIIKTIKIEKKYRNQQIK